MCKNQIKIKKNKKWVASKNKIALEEESVYKKNFLVQVRVFFS